MARLRWILPILAGCGGGDGAVAPDAGAVEETLGGTGLFADVAAQTPAEGVVPYDVASPLWADGASKLRFLALPEGGRIAYAAEGPWSLPDGAIVAKTLAFPRDARDAAAGRLLVETRLLVREGGAWRPEVYVWNEAQSDAVRRPVGATVPAAWIDEDGSERTLDYTVPNENDCWRCHARDDELQLIGVKTLQLDREVDYGGGAEGQIERLAALGLFAGEVPPAGKRERFPDPLGEGDVAPRARAWLDASCAHCHRSGGASGATGLLLGWETPEGPALGVCKIPAAAGPAAGGLPYDVVPGHPEQSILLFRIGSTDAAVRMPEIPTQTPDRAGAALVTQWIAAMEPEGCP